MRVTIRLRTGPRVRVNRPKNRQAALVIGALLTPAAVMACALGCWRLAADLRWTSNFAISNGFFSHWQVWIAGAAVIEVAAIALDRYGKAQATIPDSEESRSSNLLNSES